LSQIEAGKRDKGSPNPVFSQPSSPGIGNNVAATGYAIADNPGGADEGGITLLVGAIAKIFVILHWVNISHIDSWGIEPVVARTARQPKYRYKDKFLFVFL
jgi:hypothetical protein